MTPNKKPTIFAWEKNFLSKKPTHSLNPNLKILKSWNWVGSSRINHDLLPLCYITPENILKGCANVLCAILNSAKRKFSSFLKYVLKKNECWVHVKSFIYAFLLFSMPVRCRLLTSLYARENGYKTEPIPWPCKGQNQIHTQIFQCFRNSLTCLYHQALPVGRKHCRDSLWWPAQTQAQTLY